MTYTYKCDNKGCGLVWDVEVPTMHDDPGSTLLCPHCKDGMGSRVITGGQGFILEGGRWAKDGYGGINKDKK